jgi:hypothetical protein
MACRSDRAGRGYATEAGERIMRWGAEKFGFRDVGPLDDVKPLHG